MKKPGIISLALLAITPLLTGYTSCDQFSNVTVPTSDSIRPLAIGGYVHAGQRVRSLTPVAYHVTDPNAYIIATATAWDRGGARRVDMDRHATVHCVDGDVGHTRNISFPAHSEIQAGSPGAVVSNGVYEIQTVDIAQYRRHCASGSVATRVVFEWTVRAEDFHGNRSTRAGNTIIWTAD